MRRAIVCLFITILLLNSMVVLVYANPLAKIAYTAVKSEVRSLMGSTMVKTGVRTTSKTALQRAEERWFSRLASEELAAIEKAAARAEPVVGKKGFLRTAIGIGMWATGIDLALDIGDSVTDWITGKDVSDSEELNGSLGVGLWPVYNGFEYVGNQLQSKYVDMLVPKRRVYGKYGLYVEYPYYSPDKYNKVTYYLTLKNKNGKINQKLSSFPSLSNFDRVLSISTELRFNDDKSRVDVHFSKDGKTRSDFTHVPTVDLDLLVVSPSISYSPQPMPEVTSNPWSDVWKDDKVVWVEYPDPAHHADVQQSILDAQIEPQVQPNLQVKPKSQVQLQPQIRSETQSQSQSEAKPQSKPESEVQPELEVDKKPDKESQDWSYKFKGLVTKKFPFSLPWDVYTLFGLILATPARPDIKVEQTYMGMPFRFEYKFDYLDAYMPFFRSFIVISFCFYLIHRTRSLLGGGQ